MIGASAARPTAAPDLWALRYSMVDAWRGLASLGVVVNHLGVSSNRFDLGHACVMVFFVISGYCIAAATDSCRRNNLDFREYMWRRLRRIYPPYFFAVCLFVATRLVKLRSGRGDQLSHSLVAWVQNFTLTQWLSSLVHPTSYAHENPTLFVAGFWSLNYEEQFYIVMGLLTFGTLRFGNGVFAGIVLLMVPAAVWNLFNPAISYGIFLELWIPFALGALVFFRLCKTTAGRRRVAIDLGIGALFVFSAWRNIGMSQDRRCVYMEWTVASAFALVLIFLRPLDSKFKAGVLGRVLGGFGLISYSLYLTHQMNFRSSEVVAARLVRWGLPVGATFWIQVVFMCTVAAIFWYFCERPFLNRPLDNKTLVVEPVASPVA